MKKRVLVLFMLVVMIFCMVTGCSGSKQDSKMSSTTDKTNDNVNKKSDEKITLTLWHIENDTIRLGVVERCIARFEAANPNVKVEHVPMENDPYKTKINTVMASGGEPDIFVSWGGGWLKSFVDEGKVLDIDKDIKEISDIYYDSALSLFEIDDKYWAVPFRAGAAPVYYNTKIYEDLGVEIPKTLEELEANCEILKENGYIPFALGNASQWPGALTFIWLSLDQEALKHS